MAVTKIGGRPKDMTEPNAWPLPISLAVFLRDCIQYSEGKTPLLMHSLRLFPTQVLGGKKEKERKRSARWACKEEGLPYFAFQILIWSSSAVFFVSGGADVASSSGRCLYQFCLFLHFRLNFSTIHPPDRSCEFLFPSYLRPSVHDSSLNSSQSCCALLKIQGSRKKLPQKLPQNNNHPARLYTSVSPTSRFSRLHLCLFNP